jgi:hypothetical protein
MNVREEIVAGPEADRETLLWLLKRYRMASQWQFVASCVHVRYGRLSYQTNRIWSPTLEGRVLFSHREELEVAGDDCSQLSEPPSKS